MGEHESSPVEISVIKVDGLSKPATTLIEKISGAIGGLVRPWQIRRVADAEAYQTRRQAIAEVEAEKIRAVSRIEIDDLQQRALIRFVAEETRKQENMESITRKSLPLLDESAKPQDVKDDWIVNFFDKARLISDADAQALWARILAGESNSPGKFSTRTVTFLASFDTYDAARFTALCKTCWRTDELLPVVIDIGHPNYRRHGITDDCILQLSQIGLISHTDNRMAEFAKQIKTKHLPIKYFNESFVLHFSRDVDIAMPIGHVIFTRIGDELAPLCDPGEPVPEFRDMAIAYWRQSGISVIPAESPQSPPAAP